MHSPRPPPPGSLVAAEQAAFQLGNDVGILGDAAPAHRMAVPNEIAKDAEGFTYGYTPAGFYLAVSQASRHPETPHACRPKR